MTEAADTAFAVVFGIFVVATLVLIVLVLRFTFQRVAASRDQSWSEASDADDGDEDEETDRPMTALVFAGGGTRGAVQIGMLQVLAEHGFVPDRIYGTSVGAINGAGFAGDPTPEGVERMARTWVGLGRDDVFPQGRLHGPWMYFQQRDSVYSNSGLRKIIEDGVPFARLEDAPIPFEVVVTSLVDGRERWFTYGPAADIILASAALPAIFPPVEIDGERYMDGGVVNNVPIRRAIDAGAKRVVVLMCAPPVFEPAQARRPIESVLNALFIAVHARFGRDMAQLPPDVEVVVCSAGAPGDGGPGFGDFSLTADLIAEGRREAAEVARRYGLGLPGTGSASTAEVAGSRPDLGGSTGDGPATSDPATPATATPPAVPVAETPIAPTVPTTSGTTDGRRTDQEGGGVLGWLPLRGRRSGGGTDGVASTSSGDAAGSATAPSTAPQPAAVPSVEAPAPSTHPDPGT
jgi:NTE family protein